MSSWSEEKRMPSARAPIALAILGLAVAAAPARADDASDLKNQVVVFGGVSILDATRTYGWSWGPGYPGFPGWPGSPRGVRTDRFPDLEVTASMSLGNSAVFGARYSRYVKDRLAVEIDVAVAPGHDLSPDGELCLDGRCFGSGDFGSMGVRPPGGLGRWGDQTVTAWQYGGGLAYDITGGEVRPVVVFGAGGASWSGSGESETDFELRFGAGLKILFGRVGGRVDVIDHLVLDHFLSGKSEHDLHVTAGLLVRF
jgi:hypothetical protein